MGRLTAIDRAELLGKHAGADNVWIVNFAVSEVDDFSGEILRAGVENTVTVDYFPAPVQPQFQPSASHPQQPNRHGDIPHFLLHVSTVTAQPSSLKSQSPVRSSVGNPTDGGVQ